MFPGICRRSAIGIDLGSYSIKAVQLARSATGWRLHAALNLALPVADHPVDQHMVRHLKEVLYRQGFVGQTVVLAAPAKQLVIETLELPSRSSGAPVEQIARIELARAAKLEAHPFEMGCWDLPTPARAGAGTNLMAAALRHQDANDLLDPFETEGFHVRALDPRCCALARACNSFDGPHSTIALVDLGWNSATIVLVQEGIVLYQRVVAEWSLGSLFRALSNSFDLDEAETDYIIAQIGAGSADSQAELKDLAHAIQIRQMVTHHLDSMVSEIDAAFQYVTHRYPQTPIGRLLIVGGGSRIAGVCSLLASRLDLADVKVLTPAGIVECSDAMAMSCSDGLLTTALGLAWNGVK